MTSYGDLLGPQPTRLVVDEEPAAMLDSGIDAAEVAAQFPSSSLAWATLADSALADGQAVMGYAYSRTGYHRGLDQLRRAGWKGFGPVPFNHEANQGFLRCVANLAKAAREIGEDDEYARCMDLLHESDPSAAEKLGL